MAAVFTNELTGHVTYLSCLSSQSHYCTSLSTKLCGTGQNFIHVSHIFVQQMSH